MVKRYSIITNDLEHCIECGRYNVQLHEVFFNRAYRHKSIEDGLVIPLCKELHHNGNTIGIHQDIELNMKYRKLAEKIWLEHYNKTIEDFRERYGKNYL